MTGTFGQFALNLIWLVSWYFHSTDWFHSTFWLIFQSHAAFMPIFSWAIHSPLPQILFYWFQTHTCHKFIGEFFWANRFLFVDEWNSDPGLHTGLRFTLCTFSCLSFTFVEELDFAEVWWTAVEFTGLVFVSFDGLTAIVFSAISSTGPWVSGYCPAAHSIESVGV